MSTDIIPYSFKNSYIFFVNCLIYFETVPNYKLMYETLKKESDEKDAVIKKLESQNKLLSSTLERIKEMIAATLKE